MEKLHWVLACWLLASDSLSHVPIRYLLHLWFPKSSPLRVGGKGSEFPQLSVGGKDPSRFLEWITL